MVEKYITKDVCKAKMEDLSDIKEDIKDINKKLDNHLFHVVSDISGMKVSINSLKSGMDDIKSSIENKSNVNLDMTTIRNVSIILILFLMIIYTLITGKVDTITSLFMGG